MANHRKWHDQNYREKCIKGMTGISKNKKDKPEYKNKDWLYNQYIDQLRSMETIALECNVDSGSIHYWLHKFEIQTRSPNEIQRGSNHHNWKGGKMIHRGYLLIMKKGHKRANRNGYVRNSVLVMEKRLGRPIKNTEIIHHIDGNSLNDSPDNLYCYDSNGTHHKGHGTLEKCGYKLYKKGLIKFNNGVYEL